MKRLQTEFGIHRSAWTAAAVLCAFLVGNISAAQTAQIETPLLTQAARQLGIRKCLPAIAAISERGTAGATQQDIVLDWDRRQPDNAPVFALTGLGIGQQRAALTITAIPLQVGNCAVMVERISQASVDCTAVATNEFPNYPSAPLIDKIRVYQNPVNANETYTLISSDKSCLIIRRQSSFQWPPKL